MTHRAVKDVAVVGLPDEVDGERPLAFVVLSPDSQHVTADELITFTNGNYPSLFRKSKSLTNSTEVCFFNLMQKE